MFFLKSFSFCISFVATWADSALTDFAKKTISATIVLAFESGTLSRTLDAHLETTRAAGAMIRASRHDA